MKKLVPLQIDEQAQKQFEKPFRPRKKDNLSQQEVIRLVSVRRGLDESEKKINGSDISFGTFSRLIEKKRIFSDAEARAYAFRLGLDDRECEIFIEAMTTGNADIEEKEELDQLFYLHEMMQKRFNAGIGKFPNKVEEAVDANKNGAGTFLPKQLAGSDPVINAVGTIADTEVVEGNAESLPVELASTRKVYKKRKQPKKLSEQEWDLIFDEDHIYVTLIKKIIKSADMLQTEIATGIGKSIAYLSMLFNNKRKFAPNEETAKKLAEKLNIPERHLEKYYKLWEKLRDSIVRKGQHKREKEEKSVAKIVSKPNGQQKTNVVSVKLVKDSGKGKGTAKQDKENNEVRIGVLSLIHKDNKIVLQLELDDVDIGVELLKSIMPVGLTKSNSATMVIK